jgi:acyl carrier protein
MYDSTRLAPICFNFHQDAHEIIMKLTADRLIRFLEEKRQIEGIGPDTPLFSDGTIDSVGMIELITYIEATEGFEVAQADVTLENFDSIALILDYVRSKVGA